MFGGGGGGVKLVGGWYVSSIGGGRGGKICWGSFGSDDGMFSKFEISHNCSYGTSMVYGAFKAVGVTLNAPCIGQATA